MHRLDSKRKGPVAVALCIFVLALVGLAINAGALPLDSLTPTAYAAENDAGINNIDNADAKEPACKTAKPAVNKQKKIAKGKTICYDVQMPKNAVLIASGQKVTVGNKSYTKAGGNTVAVTGSSKVTVTYGVLVIVKKDDAEQAWCQLIDDSPKWGVKNTVPLEKSWKCEEATTSKPSGNAKPSTGSTTSKSGGKATATNRMSCPPSRAPSTCPAKKPTGTAATAWITPAVRRLPLQPPPAAMQAADLAVVQRLRPSTVAPGVRKTPTVARTVQSTLAISQMVLT